MSFIAELASAPAFQNIATEGAVTIGVQAREHPAGAFGGASLSLGDKLRSIPGFDLVMEWMQRDSYTAFVVAAAGSFVLLLVMMALLKAI